MAKVDPLSKLTKIAQKNLLGDGGDGTFVPWTGKIKSNRNFRTLVFLGKILENDAIKTFQCDYL
jgi:hypothetical protein